MTELASAGIPGPHPGPPDTLHERALLRFDIAAAPPPWFRLYPVGREPLYFGRYPRGRFNAPTGEFGVLYLATDPFGAFVETYGQATGVRAITQTELSRRSLGRIVTERPLALADLTGAGLARIGADARLCTGDHEISRRWALALWAHPARIDGLVYRARHDPDCWSIAVFDRAADAIVAESLDTLLRQPALLARILDRYGFAVLPD
jgi:hypothetical protein